MMQTNWISIYMADCKIKPNTLHKKAAETLMVIDQNQP